MTNTRNKEAKLTCCNVCWFQQNAWILKSQSSHVSHKTFWNLRSGHRHQCFAWYSGKSGDAFLLFSLLWCPKSREYDKACPWCKGGRKLQHIGFDWLIWHFTLASPFSVRRMFIDLISRWAIFLPWMRLRAVATESIVCLPLHHQQHIREQTCLKQHLPYLHTLRLCDIVCHFNCQRLLVANQTWIWHQGERLRDFRVFCLLDIL